ncbi:MAG TPA: carbon storage regulator CsrA [Fimbriimonadaceae bacterium]|nr:carbon storage regulator CsrA [Fimbriimonadaceae bacterium]HRE93025.1 carbon storage regulator CsrA [Fimbriimonadaceae bacterium]HRI74251.1 carbon storage regulator CsrA [Fimbriimonadaceae bacterium]
MLVLTRKVNQSIVIGEGIEVVVLEVRGEQVRLGIKAPDNVKVYRKEIFDLIQAENQAASDVSPTDVPDDL